LRLNATKPPVRRSTASARRAADDLGHLFAERRVRAGPGRGCR
jgi:hypothetical protein